MRLFLNRRILDVLRYPRSRQPPRLTVRYKCCIIGACSLGVIVVKEMRSPFSLQVLRRPGSWPRRAARPLHILSIAGEWLEVNGPKDSILDGAGGDCCSYAYRSGEASAKALCSLPSYLIGGYRMDSYSDAVKKAVADLNRTPGPALHSASPDTRCQCLECKVKLDTPKNGAGIETRKLHQSPGRPKGARNLHAKHPSSIARAFKKAGLDWQLDFALAIKNNKRDRIALWLRLLPYLVTTTNKIAVKKWKGKASKAALIALEALEGKK